MKEVSKQISGYVGWGKHTKKLLRVINMFIILTMMASQCIHISKDVKLYTFKMSSLLYVTNTLIKLVKKREDLSVFFKDGFLIMVT